MVEEETQKFDKEEKWMKEDLNHSTDIWGWPFI